MTCGIYRLVFEGTDRVYIGQSENIEVRFSRHLSRFKNGEAPFKLQEAYINFGAPKFEVLITCTSKELNNKENEFIQLYDTFNSGLNTLEKAGPPCLSGIGNGNSKYSKEQIYKVFIETIEHPELTQQQVSDISGVSISSVRDIIYGKTHKWLQEEYPDKYEYMCSMKDTRVRISYDKYSKNGTGNKKYPSIVSPEGVIHSDISNAREFARINGLDQSSLSMLLNGHRKSHKGWKLCPVEPVL